MKKNLQKEKTKWLKALFLDGTFCTTQINPNKNLFIFLIHVAYDNIRYI